MRRLPWYVVIRIRLKERPSPANQTSTEEFTKYLTYVRNLGFEDTPDYDYLRDLFTQALKNTGDVEDGEYDWMKLNGGKGWEAAKPYSSHHHLHGANALPNSSARDLHGSAAPRASHRPGVTADRLNAAQPPPPSPAKAGVGKARERPNASGVPQVKRQNGVAGGLEATTPAASTQAQFQNSNVHLPGNRVNTPGNQAVTGQAQQPRRAPEPEPTFMQKIMKALCCGRFRVQNDS